MQRPPDAATTAAELVRFYDLQPHPEGGWYRELHRSPLAVQRADGASRSALTLILFLLAAGERSCWHRVRDADEGWQLLAGAPLQLWLLSAATDGEVAPEPQTLDWRQPALVVPAGCWQAARSSGAWTLVSCCVGPGFAFDDFEMLRDLPPDQRPAADLLDLL
jgi:predicted cupin superfamily sugar epimerase